MIDDVCDFKDRDGDHWVVTRSLIQDAFTIQCRRILQPRVRHDWDSFPISPNIFEDDDFSKAKPSTVQDIPRPATIHFAKTIHRFELEITSDSYDLQHQIHAYVDRHLRMFKDRLDKKEREIRSGECGYDQQEELRRRQEIEERERRIKEEQERERVRIEQERKMREQEALEALPAYGMF